MSSNWEVQKKVNRMTRRIKSLFYERNLKKKNKKKKREREKRVSKHEFVSVNSNME